MTLKSNDLKELIASSLKDKFEKDGFVYKKTMNEFKSQQGDFIYLYNIEQLSWGNDYSLDVRLYIIQNQIEAILEKIIGKQRHKITMGQTIGNIYKSPDGRETVKGDLFMWLYTDTDVSVAIKKLDFFYEDIAKPYFTRYKTLESVDDIMNKPPFNHCPAHVGGNFYERCMKGLIVAKLVNNPNYEKLVSIYDEEIKETKNEGFINSYQTVRDYLASNSIS